MEQNTKRQTDNGVKSTGANSRFAKAGGSCFYDSEVLNSVLVHLIKFTAKKAAKPWQQAEK